MTNIFPVIKSSSLVKIISPNNTLPNMLDHTIHDDRFHYLIYDLWSANIYIHKFNIETNRHDIIIKWGIANSYYINDDILISGTSYIIKCDVIKNVFNMNIYIFNFVGTFYESIHDVPVTLWISNEYNNGKVKFITIIHREPYRSFLFVSEADFQEIT